MQEARYITNLSSKLKLNNGIETPYLGLGTFKMKDGEETYNAVKWALEIGCRHIDTAAISGNEASAGRAIKDSGLPLRKHRSNPDAGISFGLKSSPEIAPTYPFLRNEVK